MKISEQTLRKYNALSLTDKAAVDENIRLHREACERAGILPDHPDTLLREAMEVIAVEAKEQPSELPAATYEMRRYRVYESPRVL